MPPKKRPLEGAGDHKDGPKPKRKLTQHNVYVKILLKNISAGLLPVSPEFGGSNATQTQKMQFVNTHWNEGNPTHIPDTYDGQPLSTAKFWRLLDSEIELDAANNAPAQAPQAQAPQAQAPPQVVIQVVQAPGPAVALPVPAAAVALPLPAAAAGKKTKEDKAAEKEAEKKRKADEKELDKKRKELDKEAERLQKEAEKQKKKAEKDAQKQEEKKAKEAEAEAKKTIPKGTLESVCRLLEVSATGKADELLSRLIEKLNEDRIKRLPPAYQSAAFGLKPLSP